MKKIKNDFGLERFKEINKYADRLIVEQDMPPVPPPPAAEAGAMPPADETGLPPEGAEDASLTGSTETTPETSPESPEVDPEMAGEDDTTEEMDITDLVNMVKSVKKQLDDQPKPEVGSNQKIDTIFSKLTELEGKLGEMDNVISKIDQLTAQIEKTRPKTPVEKLEMRSLDSYPFDTNPNDFFAEKQQQMRDSGKNEYVLTKGDVENYGKYDVMKSFNPRAAENDRMY